MIGSFPVYFYVSCFSLSIFVNISVFPGYFWFPILVCLSV